MGNYQIINGNCLYVLDQLPAESFDALITDPPYSSGVTAANVGNRKYFSSKNCSPDISNDNMSQRAWTSWCAEWLSKSARLLKQGSPVLVFTDWRQLPSVTDAFQWANLIWRGIAVWDKINTRPQKGRFTNQCEYIVWCSKGPFDTGKTTCLPGVYAKTGTCFQKRVHSMEKPLSVMRDLCKIVRDGGQILDPFAGSGTTVAAAVLEGYSAVGIEIDSWMHDQSLDKVKNLLEDLADNKEMEIKNVERD